MLRTLCEYGMGLRPEADKNLLGHVVIVHPHLQVYGQRS